MAECDTTIIKIHQGDDSNFDDNRIIFHLKTTEDLSGWKARFKLQSITWMCNVVHGTEDNTIELILTKEQTSILQTGKCYGWLQLIDNQGRQGTIYKQQFQILQREVW